MNSKSRANLNEGIYTIPEVARILGISSRKVRYWLKEFWEGKFANHTEHKYSWGESNTAVNFYTLIEFYVYYQLREFGVKPAKIKEAHRVISKHIKSPFPFANAKLLTDGKTVFFNDEVDLIINADKSLQLNMKEIIEPFCDKIEFGTNNLPKKYFPLGKRKKIVVDPNHQFGSPTIEGTNIQAETLYRLFRGGETVKSISKLYEIPIKSVKDAIEFYKAA